MTSTRLGIFGGTFDPPHIGHLILAAEAQHQLALDRLLWVLTPAPPHKREQPISPLRHRIDMLQAAIAGNPTFELSNVDIDRPPPHFAADTIRLLEKSCPGAELIYVMGGDSLANLPLWRKPLELVRGCQTLGVMRRPGAKIDLKGLEAQIPGITQKVRFIEAPLIDISASQIRRRIREGHPFRYYLPLTVYDIIQQGHLYR